ncbi:hypothetical protein ACIQ6Y_12475 [Streptomyces sp. NPDC096205]|uniref:hypothetical protein n=1 Tax=Streptomyces sp. NPDC096205 TaxID=3366081 RepID=UPI003800E780
MESSRTGDARVTDDHRSRAVTLYLLGAGLPYPKPSPQSVREAFEPTEAERLLSYAETVVAEMNTFEADWTTQNLQTATHAYQADTRNRHPELDETAIDALGRAYSFWWR